MVTFLNVDCNDYMASLKDAAFDIAIVDPPYSICNNAKVGSRIDKTGKMNEWNFKKPTGFYFDSIFRVSRHQIIWGANNFYGLPPSEYFCIWNKHQTVDNFASAEYAWVSPSLKQPAKVFDYSIHKHNANKTKIHPTQKPVELYTWLIKTYCKPGFKILDTHGGSMSIAIAAEKLGFDLTVCEIDADYFKIGVDLFNKETSTGFFHSIDPPVFKQAEIFTTP